MSEPATKKRKVESKTVPAVGIAAKDSSGKMIRWEFKRRAVGPNDVLIEISYSGICHSDIHTAREEWGPRKYPLVVGHEILGTVTEIGDKVTKWKKGDAVGVGCFTDSCRKCEECKAGTENYCTNGGMHQTYGMTLPEKLHPGGYSNGGYSSRIVVDENYVISIPKTMNKASTAPLLCAGITCYSPFKFYGLKKGMKLGVVGLGGLGHMAVKIGNAMGCEVTVFSRSPGKKDTALKLGATNFVLSTKKAEMAAVKASLHMIYDSVAFEHAFTPYLDTLKASGTYVTVGGVSAQMDLNPFQLIGRRLKICGSCIGGIKETQEMIDFCAKHKLGADIELIPATPKAVLTAHERAIKGDVQFRFVIDTAKTLK